MAEVKWIKLLTEMFDDEKIKLIEAVPEADMILVIWIKLLTLAGKKNMNGYIFLTENIPYTEEMLSTLFNRPVNTVRLALETFKSFGMINYNGKRQIQITNWDKHQNIEGLNKIKEQNRLRVAKFRDKQKLISPPNNPPLKKDKIRLDKTRLEGNVTCNVTSTIIKYLNQKAETSYKSTTKGYQQLINARLKEGFIVDDFKKVIDIKTAEWKCNVTSDGRNMENYLRPQTLFGTKFESYLNQKINPLKDKPKMTMEEALKKMEVNENE